MYNSIHFWFLYIYLRYITYEAYLCTVMHVKDHSMWLSELENVALFEFCRELAVTDEQIFAGTRTHSRTSARTHAGTHAHARTHTGTHARTHTHT